MARSLSLYRRRTNLVDLTLRSRPGIGSYVFQRATNFDGSFSDFETVPASGKASKSVQDLAIRGSSSFRGQTRFSFDPSDYSIDDSKPFYVRIKQVPVNGSVGSAEAMHMILPYAASPNRPVVLNGTAAAGSTVNDSLEIQLPHQCENLQIEVTGNTDLMVAFEPGGTEFRVPALSVSFTNLSLIAPLVTQLFIRGAGVDTTFNAIMSLKNNR